MRCVRCLGIAVFLAVLALLWRHITRPPVSFAPIASFVPKRVSIQRDFETGQSRYEIETHDGKRWQRTVKLWESSKFARFAHEQGFFDFDGEQGFCGEQGFFDFDGDGYEEFFAAEQFEALWVFKRRESVKGGKLPKRELPSWFPLPKSRWVLWSKIPIEDYGPELTFITEPDPRQPRKVVMWLKHSSSGGSCFLLSRDGRRLIPFTADEWTGVDSVEDLDHDGICELVLKGRLFVARAPKVIYKWDGQTYRLWWMPDKRDGFLLDAILCDLDGDGIKEIVALFDLKGSVNGLTPFRALAVYRLERGHYHKFAQFPLPEWADFAYWDDREDHAALIPTRLGAIVALKFNPPEWRWFVRNWLPSPLKEWWEKHFCQWQQETWWLVSDGKTVRVQSRWRGMTPSGVWGVSGRVVWFDLERKGYHTIIALVNGRRYPVWQGKPSKLLSGDWDGDGDDELIVDEGGKATVFKAR